MRRRAGWAAGLMTLATAIGFMIADRLILFPSTEPLSTPAERKVLGSGLELWLHRRPARKAPVRPLRVLHFIGNASRAEWEAPGVLELFPDDLDVSAWTLNYPGYGGSPGPARLATIPEAALAAFDSLAAEAGPSAEWIVSGNSLGTAAALHVATHRTARALLLQNPPPIQNMILTRFGWWNLWIVALPVSLAVPRELDSLRSAPLARAPALFLCADRDEVVPPPYQRKVVESYGGPWKRVLLEGAGHNDPVPVAQVAQVRETLDWLLGR